MKAKVLGITFLNSNSNSTPGLRELYYPDIEGRRMKGTIDLDRGEVRKHEEWSKPHHTLTADTFWVYFQCDAQVLDPIARLYQVQNTSLTRRPYPLIGEIPQSSRIRPRPLSARLSIAPQCYYQLLSGATRSDPLRSDNSHHSRFLDAALFRYDTFSP